jgi:hypothetical protein
VRAVGAISNACRDRRGFKKGSLATEFGGLERPPHGGLPSISTSVVALALAVRRLGRDSTITCSACETLVHVRAELTVYARLGAAHVRVIKRHPAHIARVKVQSAKDSRFNLS